MTQKEIKTLTIGSKLFIVHKDYAFKKKLGGRVILARVVSFVNRTGKVEVMVKRVEGTNKEDLYLDCFESFNNIEKAIEVIES